jgi:toxin-antitoxin system PIN domain toxin
VIAPDANLLIYAYDRESPFHIASRKWWDGLLSSPEPIGIPVYCLLAFVRFVTNPRIAPNPLSFAQAAAIMDSWLSLPQVLLLNPGDRHWVLLRGLSEQLRLSGVQVTDAAIAAIAIEYGAVIHTNDRDFARFPGLRWVNPLDGPSRVR